MADFGRAGVFYLGTKLESADFLQCARDPVRVAGKLNRRGIRQVFSLPTHRRLDQTTEKGAGKADDHQSDRQRQYSARVFTATASAPRKRSGIQQIVANNAENQDAIQHADQTDVEPHIAIKDMAELMGNNTLQLLTT